MRITDIKPPEPVEHPSLALEVTDAEYRMIQHALMNHRRRLKEQAQRPNTPLSILTAFMKTSERALAMAREMRACRPELFPPPPWARRRSRWVND